MDIRIQINGTFLEGLTKTDVKLSINASSPYSFGESTRTYSANIKAPRNRVNDGIFYQMRNFGYVMRDTKYEARIYIGGIAINKRFKAKVTCDEESYSVALSQSDLKMSQLPKEVVENPLYASGVGNSLFYKASDLVQRALGSPTPVTFPSIDYGGYEPGILIENMGQKPLSKVLVGKSVTVFWRYASETDEGTKYFKGNFLDIKEYDTRTAMNAPLGSTANTTAVITMDNNAYITLDMSRVGTMLNFVVLKASYNNQTVAIFQKDDNQNDITQVRYKFVSTTMNIPTYLFTGLYISRDINVYNRLDATPPAFMSPDEAVNLSGKITELQNSGGVTQVYGNCGVSDAITFLTDLCKIFQWGWKFTTNVDASGNTNVIVNVYRLLADDAREVDRNHGAVTFNEFRQDWSDFYLSTDKIEDSEGFPNIGTFKIGDFTKSIQLSKASFTAKGDVVESGVPNPQDGTYPRLIIRKVEGSQARPWAEYFKSIEYTQSLQKYYGLFSDALDVTIKAKIPYYHIENSYKENGIVWFKQLNAFFYVRSITDYNLSTQECKVKLTKINLARTK
jgi:hypothetical protein|nr:MAG TPA: hypothetical protein [Caudoviricetes sp.]